jgi:hypothetical protein
MLSILPQPQHVGSERSLAGLRRRISRDVGAGISGVDGAYHLTKQCPDTSFVVVEAQESFGGTWLTHRYPRIRSDSDLYTFGSSRGSPSCVNLAAFAQRVESRGQMVRSICELVHIGSATRRLTSASSRDIATGMEARDAVRVRGTRERQTS